MPSAKRPFKRTFTGVTRTGQVVQVPKSLSRYKIFFGIDGRVRIKLKGITFSYTGLDEAIRGMRHAQYGYEQEAQFLHELQFFVTKLYNSYKHLSLKKIDKQTEKQIIEKIKGFKARFKGKPFVEEKKHYPRQLSSLIGLIEKHNINAFIPACESMSNNAVRRRKNMLRIVEELRNRELALNARREFLRQTGSRVAKELIASADELREIGKRATNEVKKKKVSEQLEILEANIESWGPRAPQEKINNIAKHLNELANVFYKSSRIFGNQQKQIIAAMKLVKEKRFQEARKIMQQTIEELNKIVA